MNKRTSESHIDNPKASVEIGGTSRRSSDCLNGTNREYVDGS